ncbi:gliding motility lipoprotein GldD [Winogradskyella jejuensis]|uniref:Protein involved in gliding motility GldD n=1 Tax=Winogradskyella jejuensis TaxID=1089305 RepID=A0A1M5M0G4_9FLAO|nr:gliding motility lipoprotein GldD [Winogradskyella jejuensis]SHG70726.1 protein involved in gliding motility GldD [Winogradskyella jejuensis]
MKKILIPIFSLFLTGCGNDTLPKPKAFLRLDYEKPSYKRVDIPVPFAFEKNEAAKPISKIKRSENGNSISVDIEYPKLKGTVYLTYKKVTENNLRDLLRDAQNLTQKHTQKADEINSTVFENQEKNVYGMFYEVGGNAASQSQFYATDSTNHFLSGSLYFYAKPNYDSIYPAAIYLRNDIKRVMESLEWRTED